MDKSETYIKMMQHNPDLIYPKWERGFQEGDYIYDGKTAHILGHDYVGIKQFFQPNPISPEPPHHEFRIALFEPLTATSYVADESPSKIDIKTGKYTITTVYNAIWLPRQDQLQEMENPKGFSGFIDWRGWLDNIYPDQENPFDVDAVRFNSWEQLWLAFIMSELYQKRWHNGEWRTMDNLTTF